MIWQEIFLNGKLVPLISMKELKLKWLDLGKLVENLAQSPYFPEGKTNVGTFVDETKTWANRIRSILKGDDPEKRGRIPLNDASYIFVEYGLRDGGIAYRVTHTKRLVERYDRLKLRIKPSNQTTGVEPDIEIIYSIVKHLNGEHEGELYEHREDYVRVGRHWFESDFSEVLPSENFYKSGLNVTRIPPKDKWYNPQFNFIRDVFRTGV